MRKKTISRLGRATHVALVSASWQRMAATLVLAVLTAQAAWADGVTYLEYNTAAKAFDTKTCTTCTTVTDQTAWTAGWYVVSGEVTIETRISVTGDVHLILADGATFNATKGIACLEGNSITIYGQSEDEATMGVLECGQGLLTTSPEDGYAAIGGENSTSSPVNGTITVHGGKVLAHGTAYGAAIGGGYGNRSDKKDFGTIIINGGVVSADNGSTQSNGQCPAMIGAGSYMTRGNITINGGKVTAYCSNAGGQGAKIGAGTESSWGIITINGGDITVSGFMGAGVGNYGAGIGGGAFLTGSDNMTDPELDQIIITGGTINASAAYAGAAIGGGMRGKCGTIRISGGNITANAGLAAAAIGNGNGVSVNEGSIIITGGVVNATANASNARGAIGGSAAAYGPAITLGWTDEDNDRITATTTNASYRGIHGSSVTVADGKAFAANGVAYTGTLAAEELTALGSNTLVPAVATDIMLAPTGYGTYYDSEREILLPEGVKARIVTGSGDGGSLTYDVIADGDGDGDDVKKTVPAGVAVMLYSEGGGSKTITLCKAASDSRTFDGNMLGGSDTETLITAETGTIYYKLTYGSAAGHEDIFGWYWGDVNGQPFTSPAHKAWLALSATVEQGASKDVKARSFIALPSEDEATGISSLSPTLPHGETIWYTLDGRKLEEKPTTKGVYISKGKKFIIQ